MSSCKIKENSNKCIKIDDHKKLNSDICICYKGIAFDGCTFYVTIPDLRKIATFTRKLGRTGMIDVHQKYEYITFDSVENVFWATVDGDNSHIYKLDRSFNKISQINLSVPSGCCLEIQGLSFCCCSNKLTIIINGKIVEICKDGAMRDLPTAFATRERVVKILCLSPFYVVVVRKNRRDYVKAYSCDSCNRVCLKKVPKHVRILDIVTYRRKSSGKIVLYAICIKNNRCNYIYEIELKHLNPDSCNFLHCCRNTNPCCCQQQPQNPMPTPFPSPGPFPPFPTFPSFGDAVESNEMMTSNSSSSTCPYRD